MKAITFGIIIVFIGVVSCSKSSKTQKGDQVNHNETINQEPIERSKAYQDSIFYIEKKNLLENGTEEEYHNFMQTQKDLYLKNEDKFKAMMIDEIIPDSFPKYHDGLDEESYMSKVKFWLQENPSAVKSKYR